jgi:hypothetical protein
MCVASIELPTTEIFTEKDDSTVIDASGNSEDTKDHHNARYVLLKNNYTVCVFAQSFSIVVEILHKRNIQWNITFRTLTMLQNKRIFWVPKCKISVDITAHLLSFA